MRYLVGRMQTPRQITVAALVEPGALRAASFIVTLYGDVVEPRGGLLWMGTLVEVCALVGISETRVRTAVSRLVAAGRLEGMREGRRSYYRLARRRGASSPPPPPSSSPRRRGRRVADRRGRGGRGLRRPRGGLVIGPDAGAPPGEGLAFAASWRQGRAALRRFADERWGLAAQAGAYAGFSCPLRAARCRASGEDEASFVARTLLVHAFRAVVLRDPRLPAEALPGDWPEARARALFAALRRLSPCGRFVRRPGFASLDGPLPAETEATRRRLSDLAAP